MSPGCWVSIDRVNTLSPADGFLAVRVVGNGDRTPSEVGSQGREIGTQGPRFVGEGTVEVTHCLVHACPLHSPLCDFPDVPCSVPIFVRV